MRALAFAMVALLLVAGCGSPSHGSSPAAKVPSAHQTFPTGTLVGFGATEAAFASAHDADPDPRHVKGCCFLPKVDSFGTSDDDTYVVQYGNGYVDEETINLAGEPEALAMTLVKDELPPDITAVRQRTLPTCKEFLFSSGKLLQVDNGQMDHYIFVALYSALDGPYRSSSVGEADILAEGNNMGVC